MATQQKQMYIVEGQGYNIVKYCLDNWNKDIYLKCDLIDKRTLSIIDLLHKQ